MKEIVLPWMDVKHIFIVIQCFIHYKFIIKHFIKLLSMELDSAVDVLSEVCRRRY